MRVAGVPCGRTLPPAHTQQTTPDTQHHPHLSRQELFKSQEGGDRAPEVYRSPGRGTSPSKKRGGTQGKGGTKKRGRRVWPKKGARKKRAAKMLFPSSGRHGFDDITLPDDCARVAAASAGDQRLRRDRSVVVAMLTREDELRLSSRVQRILGDFPLDGEMIYAALQMQAAAEVGFDDPAFGMQVIRAAAALFPGDTAMLTIPLYRRFNKSERGSLKVGDSFPDVHVVALRTDTTEPTCTKDARSAHALEATAAAQHMRLTEWYYHASLPRLGGEGG